MKTKLVVMAIVLFFGLALIVTPSSDEQSKEVVEQVNEADLQIELVARDAFLEGCVSDTITESECVCMYNYVRQEYTIAEITKLNGDIDTDTIYSAVLQCVVN